MKQYLIFFAALLSAIIVGLIGYEWYKTNAAKQDQGYRTAAYLSQGMVIASSMKVASDSVFQYDGKLPCTAADYEASGYRLGVHDPKSMAPQVEVSGCGEFRLIYKAFDGTPAGQIVLQATENSESYGSLVKWTCVSPSYKDIQDAFPGCTYDGSMAASSAPDAPAASPQAADDRSSAIDTGESCGLDAVLYRSVFTDAVVDRTPQNRIAAIGPSRAEVFFFTEIVGASGKRISHQWFHNGVPVSSVQFDVGSDRWRTWSSKRLAAFGPGTLHIEVRDDDCLIGQESVRILDEEPPELQLYGPMSPYQAVEAALELTRTGNKRFDSVVQMTPVGELIRFDDGDTPLHRAIRTGNDVAVRALLADAEQKHKLGIRRGLQILYDYDAGGRQALDIARDTKQHRMISALEPLVARSSPEWVVSRARFTSAVRDGEPVDCRSEAYDDESSLTFFAEMTDAEGRQVKHEWIFDDAVRQTNEFTVGSGRWTTQSTRQFSTADVGQWRVKVTSVDGHVLRSEMLRFDELNDINESRRETYSKFPCNTDGSTLLSFARAYAPIARFEYLLQKGALLEPRFGKLMTIAVEGQNISLLRWLLDKGYAIDDSVGDGHTPLTLASELGHANTVLFLAQQGADLDLKNRLDRLTPIAYATTRDHAQVTRILLEWGAQPNDASSRKVSALARAVRACNRKSTRLLLEYGADPAISEGEGHRPIDYAEKCVAKGAWTAETPEFISLQRAEAQPSVL